MPEKAKVFFAGIRATRVGDSKIKKVEKLFKKAEFGGLYKKDDLTAIKVHFGERGNDTFLSPVFTRAIAQLIKTSGAKPFVTDTNTLYRGQRHNAVDHLMLALEHGFSFATIEAPVIIADGLRGHDFFEIPIDKKHFEKVKIADAIVRADSMMVVSHFKGHAMAGFGGAIKNLAMGCAPARGKREQHSANFFADPAKCTHCGECVAHCPEKAIKWENTEGKRHALILREKCIGCGECMTLCSFGAVDIDWEADRLAFTERMVEYAYGADKVQKGKVAYYNFLIDITPECDCAGWSDAPLVPDIGILASTDPVALDKACYDLVNAQAGFQNSGLECNHAPGEDKFKGASPTSMGEWQFQYAESIGMGSTDYELIEI